MKYTRTTTRSVFKRTFCDDNHDTHTADRYWELEHGKTVTVIPSTRGGKGTYGILIKLQLKSQGKSRLILPNHYIHQG